MMMREVLALAFASQNVPKLPSFVIVVANFGLFFLIFFFFKFHFLPLLLWFFFFFFFLPPEKFSRFLDPNNWDFFCFFSRPNLTNFGIFGKNSPYDKIRKKEKKTPFS